MEIGGADGYCDDEADISFVLRLVVGALVHTVFTASNGEQVAALAREHRPELIVSVWMMPQMDGTIA
jgi:CheY-like chemotaxis protein